MMFAGIHCEYPGRTSQFKASFIPACRQNIFIAWICESRIPSEAPVIGSSWPDEGVIDPDFGSS